MSSAEVGEEVAVKVRMMWCSVRSRLAQEGSPFVRI